MLARAISHLNHLRPRPDFVLITGDLTDEGSPDEYAALRGILSELELPFRVMAGNHDNRENLRRAFHDHSYLPRSGPLHFTHDVGAVRIIALDTTVPGEHHGELDAADIAWLDRQLDASRGQPTVIAMHHPPFETGISYLDKYGLRSVGGFEATLLKYPHVERVLVGHVHRSMQVRLANATVVTCPSTATQIALRTERDAEPASCFEPPACLLHMWKARRPAVTHLSYIGAFPGPYPFA
jgi:3',5'-cyclic AMP phosphodiesterase CpdA